MNYVLRDLCFQKSKCDTSAGTAVYVGHAEADLAMTELFGRFPTAFYNAYSTVNPIDPGYKDRRDLYNLYHLLNHLNLFGGSYLHSVLYTLNYYI